MRAFVILDTTAAPIFKVAFTTRERAERKLCGPHVDPENYFIREVEISDEHYFKLLAAEAREDDVDEFQLGGES